MLALATDAISKVFEREITRFIESTARRWDCDRYQDRRTSTRYHRSRPMFVARLNKGQGVDVSATLRDVSMGGVGFFCDRAFPVGALLGIKLFWSDPNATRVPAIVRHSRITHQGFLIGAQFVIDNPQACRMIQNGLSSWYG